MSKNHRLKEKDHVRKKGMVKQSMAEEDTVGDEDDGIMSEDAAEGRSPSTKYHEQTAQILLL